MILSRVQNRTWIFSSKTIILMGKMKITAILHRVWQENAWRPPSTDESHIRDRGEFEPYTM